MAASTIPQNHNKVFYVLGTKNAPVAETASLFSIGRNFFAYNERRIVVYNLCMVSRLNQVDKSYKMRSEILGCVGRVCVL